MEDNHEKKDPEREEKKEFKFLNETIKLPDQKKKFWRRICLVLIMAAAAGAVAAFVFALVRPVAEHIVSGGQDEHIDIGMASSSESISAVSASSVSGLSGQGADDSASPAPDADTDAENGEGESAMEAYSNVRREINDMVMDCEKSLVQVTGIRSEMDYFNSSFVNSSEAAGVIIANNSTEYYILTMSSATSDAEHIRVRFYEDTELEGTVVRSDSATGLSVVKVTHGDDSSSLQSVTSAKLGNSYTLARGETVVALGNPMGYEESYSVGAVTSVSNTVSLVDRNVHLLTTDIKGSSEGSGILISLDGEVVGIIDQSLGSDDSSIVKAIGISEISDLIQKLTNNQPRAYLGIRGENVTSSISASTGIPEGVLATEVVADSPAMLAGLKQQDVITTINGEDIKTMSELTEVLESCQPGARIKVGARRKGANGYEEVSFDVTVGEC